MSWKSTNSLTILLVILSLLRSHGDTLEKIEAIQSAQVDELPELWKQHGEESKFRYLVMTRWLETAPNEFFKNDLSWQEFDRAWSIRGRLVGKALDGPLTGHPLVRKMLEERVIPHFFAGLAEVRPEEVMEFARTREKNLNWWDKKVIADGIIAGFAQTNPDKAVALVDRKASHNWKSQYPNLALRRWIVFHPQEAISLISKEEEMAIQPELAAILALQLPDQFDRLYRELPTGSKKRASISQRKRQLKF